MARLQDAVLPTRAVTPLRVALILIFLCTLSGCALYLAGGSMRMVYWGVYARLRPMVSEQDLLRQGKQTPGTAHTPAGVVKAERRGAAELPLAADSKVEEQQQKDPPQQQQPKQQAQDGTGDGPVTGGNRRFALTKDMVARVAQDRMVLVTWANFHYRDFVMNWVEHLRAVGCNAFIVGAMDDKLLDFLVQREVPVFSMSSGLTLNDFGWGTPTFHKMGREKIHLIHSFTKMGFDVLISDVDTVWLRNPLPYMKQYPEADILTSSDHLMNTVTDEGLERWPDAASAANIGIMLFRPKGHDLAAEWTEMLDKDDKIWDQNGFNDLMRRGSRPSPDNKDRLFECYDGKLKCGILPVSLFCSGHTGFTQNMPGKLGLKPYVVHATFQYSGTPGKRHRMRERIWWNDGPEYFSEPPAGFIVYDPDIPSSLLDAVRTMERNFTLEATTPHFNLVNFQLRQLRAAFAVATITGRGLVLPQLWCGMDRWWAPHDGTIPGSVLELPYMCPADHVLDLEAMTRPLTESEHGPSIVFREYSFLQRQEAAELNKSTAVLQVCPDESADTACSDGISSDVAKKLRPQLDEKELAVALKQGPVANAKVLRIEGGIERLFRGWTDEEAGRKFKRRLDVYGSIWCCINAHPGHIWYDFFWDQVPHMDRHKRAVEGTWKPITGP
ncbi:hypothetical protein ABPG77_000924 [Micractinium sp. CCAP 211/92]